MFTVNEALPVTTNSGSVQKVETETQGEVSKGLIRE